MDKQTCTHTAAHQKQTIFAIEPVLSYTNVLYQLKQKRRFNKLIFFKIKIIFVIVKHKINIFNPNVIVC